MAFHVAQFKEWRAGEGTPVKYSVRFELDCDLIGHDSNTATFRLTGSVIVENNPYNSQNSWPASDFAVLTLGGFDPVDYPFTHGVSYYQNGLPTLPNAPQSYVNALLVEFRGDTERPNPNKSSLYVKGSGVVLNTNANAGVWTFNINTTFDLKLTGDPYQEVLIYNHSGANNSTEYNWLQREVWATMLDFDYRPGETWDGGDWLSHNRGGGVAEVWEGSWNEMRTEGFPNAKGNPPECYRDGDWWNMAKIGRE